MRYDTLKGLSESQFRRAAGVKRATFELMVKILEEAHKKKKARGGRPNKLAIPGMLLMTLEYLREYRTYLHIATSYGVSESGAFQTIRWVEHTLIQCKEFKLPGKKALLKTDHEFEVVLIDATESPIERPKKNSADFTRGKRSDTRSRRKSSSIRKQRRLFVLSMQMRSVMIFGYLKSQESNSHHAL
jgi:hypothetical protein